MNSDLKNIYFNLSLAVMLTYNGIGLAFSQESQDLEKAELRNKYQTEFIELYDQKLYLQSLRPAKEVVALSREIFGENNYRLITPLNNLGSTYYMVGEYELSQEIFKECIQLIELNRNIISPELSSPLYGIALTLNQFGQYDDAIKVLERALRINHVNNGLYNLDQIKIHDSLTESYIGIKDVEKANHHQSFQVFISKKYFGIDNPQVDESLDKLSNWYKRTGQVYSEREIHKELLNRQESRMDGDVATLIETYKNLSFSHRREGIDIFQSVNPLKEAIEVIDLMENPNLNLKFEVLLDLGDTYISFGRIQSAKKAYLECWMLINENQALRETIEDRFSQPVRVRNVRIPKSYPLPPIGEEIGETIPGSISLRYDVDLNGQTINIEVIESTPEDIIDREAIKAINRVVYRPRYINAEPQLTEGLNIRHEYNVRLLDIEEEIEDTETEALEESDAPLENPIG